MLRKLPGIVAALLALALVVPYGAFAVDDGAIPELTNRYGELNDLEDSADATDSVVTTTRVGVLISANRALDGVTVSFSGEVVGDIMWGGDGHKWLNVLGSDGGCVGVWVDDDMANRIANVGSYSTTGSKLQVRGIYHIDCKDHQGELDVHALDIRVVDAGGSITHYVEKKDVLWGMILVGVGFLLMVTFIMLRVRSDRRQHAEHDELRGSSVRRGEGARKESGNR